MKTQIDVENRAEADQIRTALALPDIRAFVRIVGVLAPLTPRARQRVLTYAVDKARDEREDVPETTPDRPFDWPLPLTERTATT